MPVDAPATVFASTSVRAAMTSRASTILRFGDFELHADGPFLLRNGSVLPAEPRVLEVLAYLAANSQRVVPKSELLDTLWKDLVVVDGVVHRCVSQARRLLGDDRGEQRFIATRGRLGYQFVAPLSMARGIRHSATTRRDGAESVARLLQLSSVDAPQDGSGDDPVASEVAAAEHAANSFAFEAAAKSYERAATVLSVALRTSEQRLCELNLETAESWSRAGDDSRSQAAYREVSTRAARLGDADLLARAAIGLTARFGQPVDFGSAERETHSFLERALEALPDRPSPRRSVVLACLAFSSYGAQAHAEAAAFAMRSETDARACSDTYALCVALLARHLTALEPGNPARAAGVADELIAEAEKSSVVEMMLAGQTFRVFRCLEEGTGAELDRAIATRTASARRWPGPQSAWWTHTLDAAVAMMRGDWRRCDDLSREARSVASRSENSNQELAFRTQQAQVHLHRADFTAALEASRESARQYPHLRAGVAASHALAAALGETDEATGFVREWKGKDLASSLEASNWLFEASCLGELAFRLRDRDLAASLREFLLPHRDRNVIVGQGIAYNGPVARTLGTLCQVLGRFDESTDHFGRARDRAVELGALPWIARVEIDHARVLRERNAPGDAAAAAGMLERAASTAVSIEATGLQLELALMGA